MARFFQKTSKMPGTLFPAAASNPGEVRVRVEIEGGARWENRAATSEATDERYYRKNKKFGESIGVRGWWDAKNKKSAERKGEGGPIRKKIKNGAGLSPKPCQNLSKRHEGFLTLSDENGKQMTSPSVMLGLLPRRMEAVGFWCLEPDVKASPNVDANPQLLRLHRSQYAR